MAAYRSEVNSAEVMKDHGYNVRHTPQPRGATTRKGDYEVETRLPGGETEWRAFENKKVVTGTAKNHVGKLDGGQASRYAVDLKGSGIAVEEYKAAVVEAVRRGRIPAPREIMLITENNGLTRWVPDVWRPLPAGP
jgi:hypothetical protein